VADHGVAATALVIVFELVAGVAVGIGVGLGGGWLMRRAALPSSGLYPLAVLCLTLLAYGAAAGIHASGFAAI
jgi:cell volume regulation protein A